MSRLSLLGALRDPNRAHLPFLLSGLFFALAGGFSLAVLLPIDAIGGFGLGPRWPALAQVHGHVQTVGFAGLIVVGVALRVAPRFAAAPAPRPALVVALYTTMVAAVALRSLGQALSESEVLRGVMAVGAWLEVAAAIVFAAALWPVGRRALRARDPLLLMIAGAVFWFLMQSLLGAIWLTEAAADGQATLSTRRDATLVFLQVQGFLAVFVVGVAWRVLPVFGGGAGAPRLAVWVATVLIQAGIATTVASLIWWAEAGDRLWALENIGLLSVAAGWCVGVLVSRPWRRPQRLRPVVQPLGRLLQMAMGWLLVGAGLSAFFALRGLVQERGLAGPEMDAVRHLISLGVVFSAIVAMAHLVLPEFGLERIRVRAVGRRALIFGVGISAVAMTRAAPGVADLTTTRSDYWHMAGSGVLGFVLIGWFAFLVVRVVVRRPMLLTEVRQPVAPASAGEGLSSD